MDKLIENAQRPAPEEEARRRVLEKLAGISRLPPHHEALTTPVLLSIESMYAELLSASTDEARELCIRESFPNPAQMSSASVLIELLDPSIDINDPVIRDADVDSLIKVVLFEERHRYEQAHPSLRPPPSNAPLPPPTASPRRGGSRPHPHPCRAPRVQAARACRHPYRPPAAKSALAELRVVTRRKPRGRAAYLLGLLLLFQSLRTGPWARPKPRVVKPASPRQRSGTAALTRSL